jgi:hypothetical protein
MKRLGKLHDGLSRVRRYRTSARFGSAFAIFIAIALWFMFGAFLLDLAAHMGKVERAIILIGFIAIVVWAFRRYLLPALGTQEEEVALALMVERQQGVGSDLVAALQFSDTGRQQFGSSELREATVSNTDQMSGRLNYLEGFSREEMAKRIGILVLTVAIVLIPIIGYSGYALAFVDRFFLGSAHYPTDTMIAGVKPDGGRAPYGQPLEFKVRIDDESKLKPETGTIEITAIKSDLSTVLTISKDPEDPLLYVGRLERVLDDLEFVVYLGDAYTEPQIVEHIPLAVVNVDLKIETPAYAQGKFSDDMRVGRQQVALEGSRVVPIVSCSNKKLEGATITIGGTDYTMEADGDNFTLTGDDTPLSSVTGTLRYEVQVKDEDGLGLERKRTGTLQVRPDQPPRIATATYSQYVLPSAEPAIQFSAFDDFALQSISVRKMVEREDDSADDTEVTEVIQKLDGKTDKLANTVRIGLEDLNLRKGDRVSIIFEATDFRGGDEGKTTRGDRLVFQVTDRAGILAASRQIDAQMGKKLDQIIKAQLGIGE